MIRTSSLLLILFLFLGGAPAHAGGNEAAFRKAYEAGQDAYHLGRFDVAASHFARARDLDPAKPGPWRWLGRTERARKRWETCVEAAVQALRLNPRSPHAAEIRRDVAACRSALGRPPYPHPLPPGQGALFVEVPGGGPVEVYVDEAQRGATPIVVPVNAGRRAVELRRVTTGPGPRSWSQRLTIDVPAGVVVDLVLPAP